MDSKLPAQPLAFEATVTGDTVTIVLRGEFDITSAAFLSGRLARIQESQPRRVVFEMTQVGFLDCASARLIANTGSWLPAGVKPVIHHPSPIVRRLLDLSSIGTLCDLDSSPPVTSCLTPAHGPRWCRGPS
jgi:anti-anti-sigma factor